MYCGIDVSKNKSNICIMDEDKKVKEKLVIEHNKEGFEELEKHITKKTKIAMEVTGSYCKAIYNYLKDKGYDVSYVDSIQMYNFAKLHFSHIKNDTVDAKLLAMYLVYGFKRINHQATDEIKDLSRLYYKTRKQLTRYKYMFLDQLNVIFPELEKNYFMRKTKVIARMLLKYPSPQLISEASTEDVRNAMIEKLPYNSQQFTPEYVAKLQELARNSIGVKNYPTACFQHTVKIMLFYQDLLDEVTKSMDEALSKTPYYKLLDEFGYNKVGLATIVGEVGDIRRFENHKKFVNYCGLDISEKQSGKSQSYNCFISKRGNKYLRDIFYNQVMVHLCYKTEQSKIFYRLKEKGKLGKKCMVATARKLAVKCYFDMRKCHS